MTTLPIHILPQPNDTTCGPTCLHAVYRYFGDEVDLDEIIQGIERVEGGGTLAPFLGIHALRRGYDATLFSFNLNVFDPTWFGPDVPDLAERLEARARHKQSTKMRAAIRAYREFLALGGKIRMEDLSPSLLRRYLRKNIPILTGLSATYLYRIPREFGPKDDYDDIKGDPSGHFVVLAGIDTESGEVAIADPLFPNPAFQKQQRYRIPLARVVTAILLGVMTYDANLLILTNKAQASASRILGETLS